MRRVSTLESDPVSTPVVQGTGPVPLYPTMYQPLYLKYPPLYADADKVCVEYPPLYLTPSLHSYYHFKLLCLCSVPSNVTQ